MGELPLIYEHDQLNEIFEPGIVASNDIDIKNIITRCVNDCNEILKNNEKLLIEISKYLSSNSKISQDTIIEYIEKYGTDVDLKNKDNYYNYKEILKNK